MENKEMVVREEVEQEVLTVKQATVAIVARATNLIVNSPEKNQVAAGLSGDIKKAIKTAEAARKKQTKPLDDIKKWIKGLFAPYTDQLKKAASIVDDKIRAYYRSEQEKARIEEEKRQEAERQRQEAIKVGERAEEPPQEEPSTPKPQATTRSLSGHTVTIKSHWVHKVTDKSKVPSDYWVIDEGLIKDAIRMGVREIPGVKIWDEGQVSTRTR